MFFGSRDCFRYRQIRNIVRCFGWRKHSGKQTRMTQQYLTCKIRCFLYNGCLSVCMFDGFFSSLMILFYYLLGLPLVTYSLLSTHLVYRVWFCFSNKNGAVATYHAIYSGVAYVILLGVLVSIAPLRLRVADSVHYFVDMFFWCRGFSTWKFCHCNLLFDGTPVRRFFVHSHDIFSCSL